MRGGVKNRKNIIKLAILGWFGILAVLFAMGASRWFGDITQSEQTNEIFNEAAKLPADQLDAVLWQPDRPDLRREMEPLTRVDVTSAWLRAWEQLSIVAQTGDTTGLEVYFSNSALEGLLASVGDTQNLPTHQIAHELRIDFYSQDGQVIGLTADRVELVRAAEVGDVTGWLQTDESYEAILLLEDGNWRIQHWVRRDIEDRWWTEPVAPATDGVDIALNGINYYPKDTPFDAFWPNYDGSVVDADFQRIADLGLDSVRIFLPFDGFLGRWTTEDELVPVLDLMDRADAHGLGVVVTLFDGRTDHRTDKWDSDRTHLTTVVEALRDHPALAMWDLKNEPDRDIGANEVPEQLMYAWLGHIGHSLRELDSRTPTTVGWSTAEAALAAPVQVDVLSFHHYGTPETLSELGPQLVAHADGRPLFLSEYGLPTWNSIFPGGHTEAEQAAYYADIGIVADNLGIENVMPWTLWDLAAAPTDAGLLPWNAGPQTHLGLLRADGSPKPAAALLQSDADLEAVPSVGLVDRLTQKTFWRLVAIAVIGLFGLWLAGGRIRDRRNAKTKPRQRRTAAEVDALSRHRWETLMEDALGDRRDTPDDRSDDDGIGVVAVDIRLGRRPVPEGREPAVAPEPAPVQVQVQVLDEPTIEPVEAPPVIEPEPEPQRSMLATLEQLARPEPPTDETGEDDEAAAMPWERLSSQLTPPPIPIEARIEHGWVGTSILDASTPND